MEKKKHWFKIKLRKIMCAQSVISICFHVHSSTFVFEAVLKRFYYYRYIHVWELKKKKNYVKNKEKKTDYKVKLKEKKIAKCLPVSTKIGKTEQYLYFSLWMFDIMRWCMYFIF